MRQFVLLAALVTLSVVKLMGQQVLNNNDAVDLSVTRRIAIIEVGGSVGTALGDLKERFDYYGALNLGFTYKTSKHWLFSTGVEYLFADFMKFDPLAKMRDPVNGYIIGNDGNYARIEMTMRGYCAPYLKIGKLRPLHHVFKNTKEGTGIIFQVGAGYLEHWVNIQDLSRTAPQVTGKYKTGYDRMTNGVSLMQTLAYQHISKNSHYNFLFAIDARQGFTKNRRYNADLGFKDNRTRLDASLSLRICYVLPLMSVHETDEYYY